MIQTAKKHPIKMLTAGVIALATVGGGAYKTGFIPTWEGTTNLRNGKSVAIHQKFDPKGVITVCHGHTNLDDPKLKAGDVYTAAMCADILRDRHLPHYNAQLASCLPADFKVGDRQHVAMISFILNVGKKNFCQSSVGKLFRAGKRDEACKAMGKFTRANGVVLKGLERRRYDKFMGEIAWCLRDD
jgi:GH24 family phage-related lysozyme (muramidase)